MKKGKEMTMGELSSFDSKNSHSVKVISIPNVPEGDLIYVVASGERDMFFSFSHHGDRDEMWVVVRDNGIETARHNMRYIASIYWG